VAHPFLQNRLSVSLGARMDANNYSSQMNNLLNQFSPRLGASYSLTNKLFLNGSIARYYQMPAYTTLGYKQGEEYINRTNQLKYIHADHYILGFEFRPNNFTKISVEGFVKNYSNYPFSVLDSVSLASKGGDYGVFGDEEVTPTSSGKTKGFEVMIQRRSPKQLNYIFAYTFVRSEFTDAQNQYIPSSWDCKHLFTATISKNLKKNWEVGMKWRYSGGLPYTPYDFEKSSYVLAWDARGREYLDYSKFNTQRLAAFHQLDLRVDKTYTFKNWSLGLYMDIQNAYNKKSQNPDNLVQVKDANGQPIILNTGDPIELQKYQLKPLQSQSGTILPTIGVIVEF
jgi:outer membrane receptor for ferrienterochelin and colicin